MKRVGCTVIAAFASLMAVPASHGEIISFVIDPAVDAKCEIVVADDAIPAERTAALLLVRHLPKMMPEVSFVSVAEGAAKADKRIYVGATKALSEAGFDVSGWGVEDELLAARGNRMFIAGGRPRGARYAAADFLEGLGMVVAAEDTQVSPRLARLEWARPDVRRRPAFRARYTATAAIRQNELNEFNKYNGYRGGGDSWGGYAAYGKYGDCHTFVRYSKELPLDVPEVFAMVRGKRAVPAKPGLKAPLCPSNPKTLELFIPLLEADVRRSFEVEKTGRPRPLYYEVSMDDELTPCECAECRRINKEEGCYAGVMLRLVNPLARRLAELDPAAMVTMLVYQKTLEFPKKTKPEPNVQPRICVHDNEWKVNVKAEAVEPISSPHNAAFRETLERWASSTRSFGVWEYWEYYTKGAFPCIAPRAYVENMRYYKTRGAENILVEMQNEMDSFFAFKNWLALKLMDNPYASFSGLAKRFFAAYYGAAAKPMWEYLYFLAAAVEGEYAKAPMGPRGPMTYEYLDAQFFRRTYGLLADAEAAAAGDTRSLMHVRSEYIMPDRALLRRDKAPVLAMLGIGRKRLIARLRQNEKAHIVNLFGDTSEVAKSKLKRSSDSLDGESIDAPLPSEVRGNEIFDYKFSSFHLGPTTRLVDDPDALGGKAVEVWGGKDYVGSTFHKLPLVMGTYNHLFQQEKRMGPTLSIKDVPQDEKFHLYHIWRTPLVDGGRVWLHWTWQFQFYPRDAYAMTPDYESDVWISVKAAGPTYVKGSSKPDGIFIDRVIIAR